MITLFPVLGLVQAGGQSMADRYMYLPSMGPVLMISIVFSWIWKKLRGNNNQRLTLQFFGYGSILFILLTMSYLTINQIRIWNNPLSLWNYVINKEPEKALFAYYNRAHAYARTKQYQNAIADYTRVINNNYQEYSKVYIDRGLTYLKVGQTEPALADLKRACELGDVFGCKAMMFFKKPR